MSFPLRKRPLGQLAQLVEHRPYKAGATGSSPVLPTKKNQNHPLVRVVFFVLYIHNNLKNNKKREYSNVLPFCIHRGRPFAEQHSHMREWARDHARFRGGWAEAYPVSTMLCRQRCSGWPAGALPLPGLAQFSPEGTGKDGFFHLVDALQYLFGSFPGLLLPGKDTVQNADDLLLFFFLREVQGERRYFLRIDIINTY